MPFYEIDGIKPVVHPSSFVHPEAVVIGDVLIGPNCYIAPFATLRGDFGRIILKAGVNIQDSCVLHGFPETDTLVEDAVVVIDIDFLVVTRKQADALGKRLELF